MYVQTMSWLLQQQLFSDLPQFTTEEWSLELEDGRVIQLLQGGET